MRLMLEIEMIGESFEDDPLAELYACIERAKVRLAYVSWPGEGIIKDTNGNTVGSFTVTDGGE